MRRLARLLAASAALALTAAAPPSDPLDQGRAWWAHIAYLASDQMRGRLTGSPDYDRAATYVINHFKADGLKPAGSDGWLQPVSFVEQRVIAERSSATLVANGVEQPLRLGPDMILSARLPQPATIEAPLVFIGYGLSIPKAGHDDFAGQDLRGKILVTVNGGPAELPGLGEVGGAVGDDMARGREGGGRGHDHPAHAQVDGHPLGAADDPGRCGPRRGGRHGPALQRGDGRRLGGGLVAGDGAGAARGSRPAQTLDPVRRLHGRGKGPAGLAGSPEHPTVDKAALAADVNMDMPLPLWPLKHLSVFGDQESTLGATARAVALAQGYDMVPDPFPDRNVFVRTDQFSFVRAGIPAVALKFGFLPGTPEAQIEHEWRAVRYHSPEDNLSQPVDLEAAGRFGAFLTAYVRALADAPERPRCRRAPSRPDGNRGPRRRPIIRAPWRLPPRP